ncbi:MAG: hypothetical protein QM680_14015 [Luteolibacter sp.]
METQYIPGPYKTLAYGGISHPMTIVASNGRLIAEIAGTTDDHMATKRLFIAAPDMLEALKACHAVVSALVSGDVLHAPSAGTIYFNALRAEYAARTAIAKATGAAEDNAKIQP